MLGGNFKEIAEHSVVFNRLTIANFDIVIIKPNLRLTLTTNMLRCVSRCLQINDFYSTSIFILLLFPRQKRWKNQIKSDIHVHDYEH